ncbi:putative transcription factor C2H2 family [Rosa chinensis]|uniref:Putative transcription factor C2H2 family n=1 Tax=Rosa chinensis TaxID=74649 RepID=A0A2P6QAD7_ROSCH|nr:putative transcription factor C2H2 family [Rosa chinensis]
MSCDYCVYNYSGVVDKIQHLHSIHDKLICINCNKQFDSKFAKALKDHYEAKHTLKFSFCNKKSCLNPIFEDGSSHQCVKPRT